MSKPSKETMNKKQDWIDQFREQFCFDSEMRDDFPVWELTDFISSLLSSAKLQVLQEVEEMIGTYKMPDNGEVVAFKLGASGMKEQLRTKLNQLKESYETKI